MRRRLASLLLAGTLVPVTGADDIELASSAAPRAPARQISHTQWDSDAELETGIATGAVVAGGRVTLTTPTGDRLLEGTRYEQATWESPWVTPGFAFTEVIPSWSARTPGNSFVEVRLRGRDASGATSSWDLLGRWARSDKHVQRATDSDQDDDLARVAVDTWRAASASGLVSWQLRVTLARKVGTTAAPSFDAVGAVASLLPADSPGTSRPGVARGIVLDVPRYSQMAHRGHYPQWGAGGEAWCSPTSTSMVLGYYDALPSPREYRWVPQGHVDPWVDLAARQTYDHDYNGTGNWPFNTAYAALRAGKAHVTRLASLRQAERYIKAGIPLVASISFDSGELDGAPISSTAGHLLVIVGFTDTGDVVVNDPASSTRSGVRRTYDRGQFEDAWLNGSGGTTYVIFRADQRLPS